MPESDPAAGPASDRPPADRAIDALMALTAAMPLATTSASSAPSSAASFCSSSAVVGLPKRL